MVTPAWKPGGTAFGKAVYVVFTLEGLCGAFNLILHEN